MDIVQLKISNTLTLLPACCHRCCCIPDLCPQALQFVIQLHRGQQELLNNKTRSGGFCVALIQQRQECSIPSCLARVTISAFSSNWEGGRVGGAVQDTTAHAAKREWLGKEIKKCSDIFRSLLPSTSDCCSCKEESGGKSLGSRFRKTLGARIRKSLEVRLQVDHRLVYH